MFKKYCSIENSYRQKMVDAVHEVVGNELMVALEKIHGANFQFIVSNQGIQYGSRNNILGENASFFNFRQVTTKYKGHIQAIWDYLYASQSADNPIVSVSVFGELFGGHYRGESSGKQVQRGMNYHPDNEFMVFDILISGEKYDQWMPWVKIQELLGYHINLGRDVDLHTVPVIATGKLEELLEIDPLFHTRVPEVFGLEQFEKTDADFGEGLIIRGLAEDYQHPRFGRAILKHKNDRFKEVSKKAKVPTETSLSQEEIDLLGEFSSYLTRARAEAVFSKQEYTQFGQYQGDFVKDAMDEFMVDRGDRPSERKEWCNIRKIAAREAAKVVREVWVAHQ